MTNKNLFLTAGLALTGLLAYAYTEVSETMTVELLDGSTVVYDVQDIDKVSFAINETTVALSVTDPAGENSFKSEILASMFRYLQADNDQQVQFLFGTATTAETLGALSEGTYVFQLDCALSALYQGEAAITGDAIRLVGYQYADGEIVNTLDQLTEGTLSTTRNTKGVLTLELDATFADGTAVRASYSGIPTDVDSLEELFPSGEIKSEMTYYDMDGNATVTSAVTGVSLAPSAGGPFKSAGWNRLTFAFDNASAKACYIDFDPAVEWQLFDFATAETASVYFVYGGIQVSGGPNDRYANAGTTGTVELTNNGDGTITVIADVTNWYKTSWGSTGGTPERVVLTYNGPCEGLAPVVANEMSYYDMDGNLSVTSEITKVIKTDYSGATGWKQYKFEFANSSAQTCTIQIDPEMIGQAIDFATIETQAVNFKYGSIQVSGPNSDFRNQGTTGTIQITDNGDGNCTIMADVTNWYKTSWGSTGGTPERVVLTYNGPLE